MASPTDKELADVITHLPPDALQNGWSTDAARQRWGGSVFRTVREYWVDRVNATAGYIDLSSEGLPASQLHAHAKAMLEYWDKIIEQTETRTGLDAGKRRTFSRRIVRT